MKFKSTNEIETIQLRDAQIKEMKLVGAGEVETDGEAASLKGLRARWLELYVEGAVVKDNNSQNEYYTDKYADQMEIRFKNPVIEAVLLEGHKYYDANDNLVEEVPDQKLAEDEYEKIFGKFKENSGLRSAFHPADRSRLNGIIHMNGAVPQNLRRLFRGDSAPFKIIRNTGQIEFRGICRKRISIEVVKPERSPGRQVQA